MKLIKSFPWKILKWFLFNQIILLALNLAILLGLLLIGEDSLTGYSAPKLYFSALGVTLLVSIILSLWMARRLIYPLGRLLAKARQLERMARSAPDLVESSADVADADEWDDLNRALDQLGKGLVNNSEVLQKEREELRAIMGAVSDAIVAIDMKNRILFYNSQFALLAGVRGYASDRKLNEVIRDPVVLQSFASALSYGEFRGQVSLYREGEKLPRHYQLSVSCLRRGDSEPYGAVGIFHDVTEMKLAEQIRIDFVANVSHELRTPLTSLKGYVDMLARDFQEKRYDQFDTYIRVVDRNMSRLLALFNDLLDLSSIESGGILNKEMVAPLKVTESVLKLVDSDRVSKDQIILFQTEIDEFMADPSRVEQVLVNLVQNAIRYVPQGGKIEIFWKDENGHPTLRVKDNGPGIPLEHQARIFERFYRIDQGRDRSMGGTGLGLAIVKHIMHQHGGSVELVSQPGNGCEFICRF